MYRNTSWTNIFSPQFSRIIYMLKLNVGLKNSWENSVRSRWPLFLSKKNATATFFYQTKAKKLSIYFPMLNFPPPFKCTWTSLISLARLMLFQWEKLEKNWQISWILKCNRIGSQTLGSLKYVQLQLKNNNLISKLSSCQFFSVLKMFLSFELFLS